MISLLIRDGSDVRYSLAKLFIEMKLMNVIREQEEKDLGKDLSNIPHKVDGDTIVLAETYDEVGNRIVVLCHNRKIIFNGNSFNVDIDVYDTNGNFELTPSTLSAAITKLFKNITDSVDLKSYSSAELSKYTFRVYDFFVYHQSFRTSLMEVFPANVSNRLLHPYGFLALSQHTPEGVGELYYISPEYLPKFPEDMGLAVQRLIKRIKVIYQGVKKGKINDLPYELSEPDIKILPDFRTYDNREKKYGLGLHGFLYANILYYGSKETTWDILDRNMRKIVYDTIQSRFKQFDIEFKTIDQDV